MGFCKSGLMGVKMKNQLHCTTDWLFENSIISSSEAVSSKDARLLFFFVRRNYTHTSRTNVCFIKTRICACVRPKLLKPKKSLTGRAVVLFGRKNYIHVMRSLTMLPTTFFTYSFEKRYFV